MASQDPFGPVRLRASLAARRAGRSAREQADSERRRAPVVAALGRIFGVHTAERAWRLGAAGEERVESYLARLSRDDWHVFHDLSVGANGANVDHLVIGPGGVFSLNTKNLSGTIWVGRRALLHNGTKTDYLIKAAREGDRVSRLLSAAAGTTVAVRPVLVIFSERLTIKQKPERADVVAGREIRRWLERCSPVLERKLAFRIACAANNPASWR